MTPEIDPAIAHRATQGDPDAITALLTQIHPAVVRYCRARLGRITGCGYTTADDVAQDVCLAVLSALPTYRDQGRPFAAFVYAIAANKVADAQRRSIRDGKVDATAALPDQPDATPGPEQHAVATDLARRLSTLLDRLPEAHREIIVLRVAVGLSSNEVASLVGMSPAAVRVTQSRALARLRILAGNTLDERAA